MKIAWFLGIFMALAATGCSTPSRYPKGLLLIAGAHSVVLGQVSVESRGTDTAELAIQLATSLKKAMENCRRLSDDPAAAVVIDVAIVEIGPDELICQLKARGQRSRKSRGETFIAIRRWPEDVVTEIERFRSLRPI